MKTQQEIEEQVELACQSYQNHCYGHDMRITEPSREFVRRISSDSLHNKCFLRDVLRKSKFWNEDKDYLQIPIMVPQPRNCTELSNQFEKIVETVANKASETMRTARMYEYAYFQEEVPVDKVNERELSVLVPKTIFKVGRKPTRNIRKYLEYIGADKVAGFEKEFAKLSEMMKFGTQPETLYVSVNAGHFLTMSNPHNDRRGDAMTSCHSLDSDYEYRSGCAGYARDFVSMIAFTKSGAQDSEWNRKTSRQMFFYKDGVLLQSRLYSSRIGVYGGDNKEHPESKAYREAILDVLSDCLGVDRKLWKTREYHYDTEDLQVVCNRDFNGYPDWEYDDMHPYISNLPKTEEETKKFRMYIGLSGLCFSCGAETTEGILCGDCDDTACCDYCEDSVPSEELTRVYDEYGNEMYVCEACLENHYTLCDECGEYHTNEECVWVEEQQAYVCNTCYERYYTECDDCGAIVRQEHTMEAYNHCGHIQTICRDCCDAHYVECEECGETYHVDYTTYDEESGRTVCLDCEEYLERERARKADKEEKSKDWNDMPW